jgi:hypothetical protein
MGSPHLGLLTGVLIQTSVQRSTRSLSTSNALLLNTKLISHITTTFMRKYHEMRDSAADGGSLLINATLLSYLSILARCSNFVKLHTQIEKLSR